MVLWVAETEESADTEEILECRGREGGGLDRPMSDLATCTEASVDLEPITRGGVAPRGEDGADTADNADRERTLESVSGVGLGDSLSLVGFACFAGEDALGVDEPLLGARFAGSFFNVTFALELTLARSLGATSGLFIFVKLVSNGERFNGDAVLVTDFVGEVGREEG